VSAFPIICHWYRQHQQYWWQNLPALLLIPVRCTLTCEDLREMLKKFEITLLLFLGAWGKMTHEKNLKQKIL
jgi:hypothetical protein